VPLYNVAASVANVKSECMGAKLGEGYHAPLFESNLLIVTPTFACEKCSSRRSRRPIHQKNVNSSLHCSALNLPSSSSSTKRPISHHFHAADLGLLKKYPRVFTRTKR